MALDVNRPTYDNINDEIKDQKFSIGKNGKTLKFYNHEAKKKVFEIHHYGDGKTIYFKKKDKNQKSNTYL